MSSAHRADSGPAPGAGGGGGAVVVKTTIAPETQQTSPPDPGKTAKIYANAAGIITQAMTLQSTDGLANISLGYGIAAKNSSSMPLASISIRRISAKELPDVQLGDTLSFAEMAYEIQPDGATFSPPVPLSFTIPQKQWGKEYVIQEYDNATGTWKALSGSYSPETGIITVHISDLCRFALFVKATEKQSIVTNMAEDRPAKIAPLSKPAMSTNIGMAGWGLSTIRDNPLILVIVVVLIAVLTYFGWWKRRL